MNADKATSKSAVLLDNDLQRAAAGFDASELRELAHIFEGWVAQLRFKANGMDASALAAIQKN